MTRPVLTLFATAIICADAVAADPPHSFEDKVVKIAEREGQQLTERKSRQPI